MTSPPDESDWRNSFSHSTWTYRHMPSVPRPGKAARQSESDMSPIMNSVDDISRSLRTARGLVDTYRTSARAAGGGEGGLRVGGRGGDGLGGIEPAARYE